MTDWKLQYTRYDPAEEGRREVLCALGNGYFVTRAAAPDAVADDVHYPGTYLAGCYNRLVSEVSGERIENEDLVNQPNWLPLVLKIEDGDWIRCHDANILSYRQELDLQEGLLCRLIRFQDDAGRITCWNERRFVSMHDKNVAGLAVDVTAENWSGRLTVRSGLDGAVTNAGVARYRDLEGRHLETIATGEVDGDVIFLQSRTIQSRREIALAARTRFYRGGRELYPERDTQRLEDRVEQSATFHLQAGEGVLIEKLVAVFPSVQPAISEAGLEARGKAVSLERFEPLLDEHRRAWRHLWEQADIRIDTTSTGECLSSGGTIATALRLHVFHLLQTVSFHTVELDVGVPPRGWHGEAYRGHVFWDELFIFPFLNLRMPELTRALLKYRYRRLGESRKAAREAGLRGAMFPWQSGSNGREESQRLHLNPASGRWIPDNSWRQRHIGAAIAYNVWHYYQATADHDFMSFYGAELLLEITRFWASLAEYDPEDDRYDIRGVMGPDEFHTGYPGQDSAAESGIDNNAYTNVLVAWVMSRASDVLAMLPDARRMRLCGALGISDAEAERWDSISRRLRVPFFDGIFSQFEGYERLEELDWAGLEAKYGDIHRLDRVLKAEGDDPNRYQASKQADMLMLFYLFSSSELHQILERLGYAFHGSMIPACVDYYLARTSHGSTLSWVVHCWVLARTQRAQSWEMFCDALRSDLDDVQGGTTPEGIHLGAMAGTVDIIQRCYTGIETREDALHIDPSLPDALSRLRTHVRYRQQILDIDIDHDTLTISSRPFTAPPITIAYRGHVRQISPGQSHRFHLVKPPELREPCQH